MTVALPLTKARVAKATPVAPVLRGLLRRPLAMLSLVFLLAVTVASVLAGWIAPHDPLAMDGTAVLKGPSWQHLLGTDHLGRDLLSRLLHGGGSALWLTLVGVVTAAVLAIPVGVLTGLVGGRLDSLVGRGVDVLMAVPGIVIVLMVMAVFNQNMVAAMVGFGVIYFPRLMRVTRAASLAVSQEPYIAAARVSGLSQLQIGFRHVAPRISGPVVVNLSLLAGSTLSAQAALNFLGLGTKPPAPTWGGMIADAATSMSRSSWSLVPTGGAVALSVMAFILLGDAVRDVRVERWSGTGTSARGRVVKKRVARTTQPRQLVDPDRVPVAHRGLSVDGLSVAFPVDRGDWMTVVQDVSFNVEPGETIGLVGESGCGKTLTALAVLGLLPAGSQVTSGRVVLEGEVVSAMSSKQQAALRGTRVAFISQDPMAALDPNFTVGSQVAEAVRIHQSCTRAEAKARTLELLEQVRIPDGAQVARRYPHQISGGMAQRVAIAIALAGAPSVLIADEPTTALDVTVQDEILDLLAGIQKASGMALVLISHDWNVIARICDRCVVMYAGQVVETGRVDELMVEPRHPYSIGLLDADPRHVDPGGELRTIPGSVPRPSEWPVSCHFQSRCPHVSDHCRNDPIELREVRPGRQTRCVHDHPPAVEADAAPVRDHLAPVNVEAPIVHDDHEAVKVETPTWN
ncbi:MAG TPA: dipeptide/oligopeptide/nickel ABC transporter permease/ATP-binding protein [Ilumatobacter sp.]|nr:dipeptide/oligopeptide/nickel ABC transporter permease/ATP-binding protein [Ilumatobacter sp.]